jgi:hypothetical protein
MGSWMNAVCVTRPTALMTGAIHSCSFFLEGCVRGREASCVSSHSRSITNWAFLRFHLARRDTWVCWGGTCMLKASVWRIASGPPLRCWPASWAAVCVTSTYCCVSMSHTLTRVMIGSPSWPVVLLTSLPGRQYP